MLLCARTETGFVCYFGCKSMENFEINKIFLTFFSFLLQNTD